MTDQEINCAVAEACGWEKCNPCEKNGYYDQWRLPSNDGCIHTTQLPDFCHDLNAMHEAEEHLKDTEIAEYMVAIGFSICENGWIGWWDQLHATSRQRSEAFLRVKGLWKEQ